MKKRDEKAEDDCDAGDEVEGQVGEGADVEEEDHDEDGDG